MRKPRLLMQLCLFAYVWAASGIAGLAWASSNVGNDHHQASVAIEVDGLALVLSHDSHEHEHDGPADEQHHVAESHGHDDHVLKLPNPPDSSAVPVAKDIKHDKLASVPACIAIEQPLVTSQHLVQVQAHAPPLCRNRSVFLRQSVVLLI